jgi:hypothetical protein
MFADDTNLTAVCETIDKVEERASIDMMMFRNSYVQINSV